MNRRRLSFVVGLLTLAAGCGGNDSPTTPSPTPTPTPGGTGQVTITIGNDGVVSPRTVTVAPGSRVTFTNNHNRSYDVSSDPHPSHTDCPEINQVGFLQAGQTRQTGNLNTVQVCGFHDHDNPTNRNLQGTIRIQ